MLIPENGKTTVNNYDIIKDRKKVRTSVNILMSGGWIIFDYKLSIYQNLRFWGVVEGVPRNEVKEKVEDVLRTVGLYDRKDDFPENLSSGLRQKLNLARCLLSDRPIYLLDEPTANVDPYSAGFIRDYIIQLKKRGKTIVLATHNLWEAEMLCDRIAILNKGKILTLDKTESIKKDIGKEILILELENVSSALKKEISSFDFVGKVIERENTLEIYGVVKKHVPVIVDICRKHTTIFSTDIKESSLNDVFIQLITEEEQATVKK